MDGALAQALGLFELGALLLGEEQVGAHLRGERMLAPHLVLAQSSHLACKPGGPSGASELCGPRHLRRGG